MKQIKRIINSMDSWVSLTLMMHKRFERKDAKPLVVILRPLDKTHEQLGYLHSTVLGAFSQGAYEAGEIKRNSETDGKYHLKRLISYGEHIDYNGAKVFVANSFEKASIEDLSRAIDKAIECCDQWGIYIQPPKGSK